MKEDTRLLEKILNDLNQMIQVSDIATYSMMNAIIGFTALAATHIDNKEQVKNYLKKITTSSTHLLNIVSNAIKFTPVGGTISIRVSEKPCKIPQYTTYEFRIKDNGIGMSEEFQKEVFDSFTREQTSTTNGIQGTGLGMAITKNIVDMMGGTIQVKSKEGKGSEFIVTFDCRVSGKTIKYGSVPQLQGARALVVDDDTNTCMSVGKMLREIEMRVDWTTSGKEAVIRAQEAYEQKDEFKAFIIDWLMPDMNGIETVRRIRKVIGDSVPIIILTAYDWQILRKRPEKPVLRHLCPSRCLCQSFVPC